MCIMSDDKDYNMNKTIMSIISKNKSFSYNGKSMTMSRCRGELPHTYTRVIMTLLYDFEPYLAMDYPIRYGNNVSGYTITQKYVRNLILSDGNMDLFINVCKYELSISSSIRTTSEAIHRFLRILIGNPDDKYYDRLVGEIEYDDIETTVSMDADKQYYEVCDIFRNMANKLANDIENALNSLAFRLSAHGNKYLYKAKLSNESLSDFISYKTISSNDDLKIFRAYRGKYSGIDFGRAITRAEYRLLSKICNNTYKLLLLLMELSLPDDVVISDDLFTVRWSPEPNTNYLQNLDSTESKKYHDVAGTYAFINIHKTSKLKGRMVYRLNDNLIKYLNIFRLFNPTEYVFMTNTHINNWFKFHVGKLYHKTQPTYRVIKYTSVRNYNNLINSEVFLTRSEIMEIKDM